MQHKTKRLLESFFKRFLSERNSDLLRKFMKNPISIIGLIIVGGFIIIGIFQPFFIRYDPWKMSSNIGSPPSLEYWFGTDMIGRDIYSRIIWGTRTSLTVAVIVTAISTIIGVTYGCIAGYYGGRLDTILMRIVEILMMLPTTILLIVVASVLNLRAIWAASIVMGLLSWMGLARVTRTSVLSTKKTMYVEAARAMGASDQRIIFRHILPNITSPIIIVASLNIASALLTEAVLSFLGFSELYIISWGNELSRAMKYMRTIPWMTIFPGISLFIVSLGFNLMGDGLRDTFDVRV